MAVLIRWAKQRLEQGRTVEPNEWEARRREFVYGNRLPSCLPPELHGWCRAWAVSRLAAAGLCSRYVGYDGEPLALADDITMLVCASLTLESGALMAGDMEQNVLALAFEAGVADRDRRLRGHLAQLNMHVARALDSWL